MPNQADRRDYDSGSSQSAQDNFQIVAGRLEALIDQRDADVRNAMADYLADGVSEEYHGKELRWHQAANEVRHIIRTLKQSLATTDATATMTISKAKSAVDSIA